MSSQTPAANRSGFPADASATIGHIAAAVDSHPEGRDAAALGNAIADLTGADLTLMSVEPDLPLLVPGLDRKQIRDETHEMLQRLRGAHAPPARLKVATDLSVARGLTRLITAEHRDLVVVGSSRRAGQGEVAIGKRTRQLLGHLSCALAVAPRGLHEHPCAIKRIGVGCDGEAESLAALALAAGLASTGGAQLVVRGVVDDRVPAMGWRGVWLGAIKEAWEELMANEREALERSIRDAVAPLSVEPAIDVELGRPATSLMSLSDEVDLLVIGSRRWGPLARLLLGGTGEALAHGARCSLLIVPRPRSD